MPIIEKTGEVNFDAVEINGIRGGRLSEKERVRGEEGRDR